MKIVKLSINSPTAGILRQSILGDGVWGNYKFEINNNVKSCDYWFVYSKGQPFTEISNVPQDNVVLITGEPEAIYHYSDAFVRQFSTVVTTRTDLKGPKIVTSHPAQPWWVGRKNGFNASGGEDFTLSFKDLSKSAPKKSRVLSVITSDKSFTEGHKKRIQFVEALKSHFGDQLDVFGRGFNEFDDKWDVLRDYKYHVVIENSSSNHYWTEKLADAFLSRCYPIYYGAPNIFEYFNSNSLSAINISDIEHSIRIIENAISDRLFEKNIEYIDKSKNDVLNKYNILPFIANFCDSLPSDGQKSAIKIRNEKSYIDFGKLDMIKQRIFQHASTPLKSFSSR